jgi:Tol biopolymer transport system component
LAWASPPFCRNEPLDLAAWQLDISQRLLNNPDAATNELNQALAQLHLLTLAFQNFDLQQLIAILTVDDRSSSTELVLRELMILWLNLISGRLNRATELDIDTQPDLQTVDDLLEGLNQALADPALADPLIEASRQLQAGQNISRHICGRLTYRAGSTLYETNWAEDGPIENKVPLIDVPAGITTFSPDYSKLIIETPSSDASGGPIFLFDLKTKELVNLNQQLDFLNQPALLGLTVAGWSPDGAHLFLFDQDNDAVIWTNLDDYSYQHIPLNPELGGAAPVRQVSLTPDGKSFIYLIDGPDETTLINEYNLASRSSKTLTTLKEGRGRLSSFHIAPTGDQAAYLLRQGKRTTGVSYALMHIDFTDYSTKTLVAGNLGRTEPIWSPNGQMLAFTRKTADEPDQAGANVEPSDQGDIWVITPETGQVQQLTFVEAIVHPPVWSVDSQFVAFVTQAGEVGLVSIEQPGFVWKIGSGLSHPQFTAIGFIP